MKAEVTATRQGTRKSVQDVGTKVPILWPKAPPKKCTYQRKEQNSSPPPAWQIAEARKERPKTAVTRPAV